MKYIYIYIITGKIFNENCYHNLRQYECSSGFLAVTVESVNKVFKSTVPAPYQALISGGLAAKGVNTYAFFSANVNVPKYPEYQIYKRLNLSIYAAFIAIAQTSALVAIANCNSTSIVSG